MTGRVRVPAAALMPGREPAVAGQRPWRRSESRQSPRWAAGGRGVGREGEQRVQEGHGQGVGEAGRSGPVSGGAHPPGNTQRPRHQLGGAGEDVPVSNIRVHGTLS